MGVENGMGVRLIHSVDGLSPTGCFSTGDEGSCGRCGREAFPPARQRGLSQGDHASNAKDSVGRSFDVIQKTNAGNSGTDDG